MFLLIKCLSHFYTFFLYFWLHTYLTAFVGNNNFVIIEILEKFLLAWFDNNFICLMIGERFYRWFLTLYVSDIVFPHLVTNCLVLATVGYILFHGMSPGPVPLCYMVDKIPQ